MDHNATDDELTTALGRGEQALATGGPAAGRAWLATAFQAAGELGDATALARAALGLGGIWGMGERTTTGAALQRGRLRRALDARPQDPSLVRRLRGRLAAEADYRAGTSTTILALARQARAAGDRVAWAELSSLAHHCLLGPDNAVTRHQLALDLVTEGVMSDGHDVHRLGLMWRTVDLFLDGDPRAHTALKELRTRHLADSADRADRADRHGPVGSVVRAVDVMLDIRAGRLDRAETEAGRLARSGIAAGDPHAHGWYACQLLAVRWYQGRLDETVADLTDLATTETGGDDQAVTAALAAATALASDHRRAAGALARLGGGDLTRLTRTSTWLITLYAAIEAAAVLADAETTRTAYDLLHPFADLPLIGSLAAVCLGSVHHALGVASLTLHRPETAADHFRRALRANHALEHWPAVTMTRWRLAQALDATDRPDLHTEAGHLRTTAHHEADELGLHLPVPTPLPRPVTTGTTTRLSWHRCGLHWKVTLGHRTVRVRDSRGTQYLAVLTANPERDILAATLVAGLTAGDWDTDAPTATQPVLDATARRQYQQRLDELDRAIEETGTTGDADRYRALTSEREWLLRELAAAAGLGGRAKSFITNEERARIAVGKAIRRAIDHIDHKAPDIGEHLRRHVRTGRYCAYLPGL